MSDEKINVIILVAVLAWLAWIVPTQLQSARESEQWRVLKAMQR